MLKIYIYIYIYILNHFLRLQKFQIVNYHRSCKSTTEDEEQNIFGENLRIAFIT
jgi:hypothetical protein